MNLLEKGPLSVFKYSNCLLSYKKSEKTNNPFLRKMPNWWTDRQMDRQQWFYRTFPAGNYMFIVNTTDTKTAISILVNFSSKLYLKFHSSESVSYFWDFSGKAFPFSEAIVQRCSEKKCCLRLATSLKNESPTLVLSCEFWEIFKNKFLYRTPPLAVSSFSEIARKLLGNYSYWYAFKTEEKSIFLNVWRC